MSTLSFIASLHIFIGGLGLLLNITAAICIVLNASKPSKTETFYGLSDTIGGAMTSLILFSDGCLYFAYSQYNNSCYKYHLIFILWLFPLITGYFSVLGLAIEKHKEVKRSFRQPAERQKLFTIVWLMTAWFTAIASIIIVGGHTAQHRALVGEDNTFYWERNTIERANRGLLEDLWVYNSKNDWTSDYKENAIIGLVYGIVGGNISHEALEKFQGSTYNKETIQANLKKIKQLHEILGITNNDINNVFGSILNDDFQHAESDNKEQRPLSYWTETTIKPKPNNQIAFTRPVEALSGVVGEFQRPVAAVFTRPMEAVTRPEQVYTRPVEASARPVVAFPKPEEGFPRPVVAFTRPVEAFSTPVIAFTRPAEAHTRPAGDQKSNNPSLFWPTLSETISKLHNKVENASQADENQTSSLPQQERPDSATILPLVNSLIQSSNESLQQTLPNNENIQSNLLDTRENGNITGTVDYDQDETLPASTNSKTTDLPPAEVSLTTVNSVSANSRDTEAPTSQSFQSSFQAKTTGQSTTQSDERTIPIDYTNALNGVSNVTEAEEDLISTTPSVNEPTVTNVTKPPQSITTTCISQAGFLPVFVTIIFTGAFILPLMISGILYTHIVWVTRHNAQCSRNLRWSSVQGIKKRALVILTANLICWTPLMVERLLHAWEKVPNLSVIVTSLFFLLAHVYNVLRALLYIFYDEKFQANIPSALFTCARRCNTAVTPLDNADSETASDTRDANGGVGTKRERASSSRHSSTNVRSFNNTPIRVLQPR